MTDGLSVERLNEIERHPIREALCELLGHDGIRASSGR